MVEDKAAIVAKSRAAGLSLAAILVLVSAAWPSAASQSVSPAISSGAATDFVLGNNEFALALYARVAAGKKSNVFFSPYSVFSALAMAYAGARGRTARQMADVLRLAPGGQFLPEEFAELNRSLDGRRGKIKLVIANALWGQKGFSFRRDFLALTQRYYGAGLRTLDFRKDVSKARAAINAWVEISTGGNIQNIIAPGALGASTRLVLTDAVYFKAAWASPFEERRTKKGAFYTAASGRVQASFMVETGRFAYAETPTLQVLALPYSGGLSMIVILPRTQDGLAALEKNLSAENVLGLIGALSRRRVEVLLPKFKFSSGFGLVPVLKSMGMADAFTPPASGAGADFSGMDDRRDLWISGVIHKAYIDVNEQGTEAAAATAVTMRATAIFSPGPPAVFRADHPFIFLIRDNASGAILFLGKIADPSR
ncbi:MAG TPA: serpin family protein [Elusimicrobiota bacterium]|nr:serpin family protein [Elusimicrobiota bacterium]